LLKQFKAIYTAVRMNRPDVKGKGVSLPFRPYVIYHPVSEIEQTETHGQSWLGSNIPEILVLSPFQTTSMDRVLGTILVGEKDT
jgi:hypothetical protein